MNAQSCASINTRLDYRNPFRDALGKRTDVDGTPTDPI
jgi:hypothetical protein